MFFNIFVYDRLSVKSISSKFLKSLSVCVSGIFCKNLYFAITTGVRVGWEPVGWEACSVLCFRNVAIFFNVAFFFQKILNLRDLKVF